MFRIDKTRWWCAACLAWVLVLTGCAHDGGGTAVDPAAPAPAQTQSPQEPKPDPLADKAKGKVEINITDVLGYELPARVLLQYEGETVRDIPVPEGRASEEVPAATYKAYVYVYSLGVPFLVQACDLEVPPNGPAFIALNLVEGASGNRLLVDFDADCDFAIDRAEIECGTNPTDPRSVPACRPVPVADPVLSDKEGWYCGELHCRSQYGGGTESVAQLVKRAEKAGLDFLAITDRNTLDACYDKGYSSNETVLIPAMEWGSEEQGVALLYGVRTTFPFEQTRLETQALVDFLQAQGGYFCVAHPCFPTAPWNLALGFVSGVEVWCREWRAVPPMSLEQVHEDLKERKEGKLVHSIAYAAASPGLSANGQASIFYDVELVRGLKAGLIGGSSSGTPSIPLGKPVTYVYAKEKSLIGILDGLRQGRSYVSVDRDGPRLHFNVDVLNDEKVDVSFGGIIPLNLPAKFIVRVEKANNKRLDVLLNGYPLVSKRIESDNFVIRFEDMPQAYSVYRLRVSEPAKSPGFGPIEVLAMSSPIYAQEIRFDDERIGNSRRATPSPMQGQAAPEMLLPSDPGPGEIRPAWRF